YVSALDAPSEFHPGAVQGLSDEIDLVALQAGALEEAVHFDVPIALLHAVGVHPTIQHSVLHVELDVFAVAQKTIHSSDVIAERGFRMRARREKGHHQEGEAKL